MPVELKLQLFLAVVLLLVLLLSYMITIRTIGGMEHALNRLEQMVQKEVILSHRHLEQGRNKEEQAVQLEADRAKRNELLLNIPFMEKLNKDRKALEEHLHGPGRGGK